MGYQFTRIGDTTIEFVRVERKSIANRERRENGDTRGIDYDFNVLINDEHRAEFSKSGYRTGYTLRDRNNRAIFPVKRITNRFGTNGAVEAKSQAQFEEVIKNALVDDLIPTIAEFERVVLIERAERDNREFDDRIAEVRYQKQNAAEQLFTACKDAYEALNNESLTYEQSTRARIAEQLLAALNAATSRAKNRGDQSD